MTSPTREAWLAVVQRGDEPADQDTELVTLEGAHGKAGARIELTDGTRITLTEPAVAPSRDLEAA